MRVQQLADHVDVAPHVVRYYTRVGLLRPKRDAVNGYRRFSADDVKRVVFIRQAQRLGFTLAEIGHILDMSGRGETKREERESEAEFGDEYRRYAGHTPGFFPRWGGVTPEPTAKA